MEKPSRQLRGRAGTENPADRKGYDRSEEHRIVLRQGDGPGMKVDDLAMAHPGTLNGMTRPTGRTVVPRHNDLRMVDQEIVPHGIAPAMIRLGKDLHGIRPVENLSVEASPGRREAVLLSAERDHGDQLHIGMPFAHLQHGPGGRQIESHRHAVEKRAESPGIQPFERRRQQRTSLVPIETMTRKGNTMARLEDHTFKDNDLARTLQESRLNSKTSATMKNTGIVIVSLVGGLIIGSALTMLFAPQSGADLRRKIKDSIDDEIDRVKNKLNEVEEQIEEARCRCEEN